MKTLRTLTYLSVIAFGGHDEVSDDSRYLRMRMSVDYLSPVESSKTSVIFSNDFNKESLIGTKMDICKGFRVTSK
jgi:hypothetical protein